MIRIAIVGPSPHVRGEIDAGLSELGGFETVLQTPTLADARALGFGQAQVAVVDDHSAGDDEVDVRDDGPAIVVLVGRDADHRPWWQAGASLVEAAAPIEHVAAAVKAAAAGLVACSPAIAETLCAPTRSAAARFEPLTPRESQVLQQMSFGLGNRQIAAALGISTHTAKFHVAQVIAKLDAASRAHAVANALRAGMIDAAA